MAVLSDRWKRGRDRGRRTVATLGELAPALKKLQDHRLSTPTPGGTYSDDVPADYLRLLYGLPEDAAVFTRVNALWKRNRK